MKNIEYVIAESLSTAELLTNKRHKLDHVLIIPQKIELGISECGQYWWRRLFMTGVEIFNQVAFRSVKMKFDFLILNPELTIYFFSSLDFQEVVKIRHVLLVEMVRTFS